MSDTVLEKIKKDIEENIKSKINKDGSVTIYVDTKLKYKNRKGGNSNIPKRPFLKTI